MLTTPTAPTRSLAHGNLAFVRDAAMRSSVSSIKVNDQVVAPGSVAMVTREAALPPWGRFLRDRLEITSCRAACFMTPAAKALLGPDDCPPNPCAPPNAQSPPAGTFGYPVVLPQAYGGGTVNLGLTEASTVASLVYVAHNILNFEVVFAAVTGGQAKSYRARLIGPDGHDHRMPIPVLDQRAPLTVRFGLWRQDGAWLVVLEGGDAQSGQYDALATAGFTITTPPAPAPPALLPAPTPGGPDIAPGRSPAPPQQAGFKVCVPGTGYCADGVLIGLGILVLGVGGAWAVSSLTRRSPG